MRLALPSIETAMPLDRINGEVLDGLAAGPHVPIPPRLLAEMSNFRTAYRPKAKFITARKTATRPVFDDAVANAVEAFAAKGALRPIRFDEDDVLVQLYPSDLKLAVVFQRRIGSEVYYAPSYYDCPKPVLDALLAAAGRKAPDAPPKGPAMAESAPVTHFVGSKKRKAPKKPAPKKKGAGQ